MKNNFYHQRVLKTSVLIIIAVFFSSYPVHADSPNETIINGIITEINIDGEKTFLSLIDGNGQIITLEIKSETKIGLESAVGERWVSDFGNNPIKSIEKLIDQQKRFVVINIVHDSKYILSITNSISSNLETNLNYLFIVFAIGWLIFFGYMIFLNRKTIDKST